MSFFDLVFGRRASALSRERLPVIDEPPAGIVWREIRPRKDHSVQAWPAERSGVLNTRKGRMRYKAGEHYIVERAGEDRSVVRRDVFERTYQGRPDGSYEKRTEIAYQYFTLPYPAMIRTLEGLELAKAGDWIVEGVDGELWPVPPEAGEEIYEPAP